MCAPTAVRIQDKDLPFLLQSDAINVGIGAVHMYQAMPCEYPVSFYSQGLKKPERNYTTYEKELLAVVKPLEAFRIYLLGKPFVLRWDHKALAAIFHSQLKTYSRVVKGIKPPGNYILSRIY